MRAFKRFGMRRKGLYWSIWLPVLFAVLLLSAQTAGAVLIDDFSVDQGPISVAATAGLIPPNPTVSDDSDAAVAGVIGGFRSFSLDLTRADTSDVAANATVNGAGVGRFLNNFETDAYGHVHLVYSGNINPANFDLNANLCAASKFNVVFNSNDHQVHYTMFVYTDAGNWSSLSIDVSPLGPFPKTVEYKFADFAIGAGTGADFCNVGQIHFHWDTEVDEETALDMSLDLIDAPNELEFRCDYKTFDGQSLLELPLGTVLPHNITAEVSISNTGIGIIPIGAVTITDTLDAGLTYIGPTVQTSLVPPGVIVDPPDSIAGQVITWTNQVAIGPNETVVFQYLVQVDAGLLPGQTLANDVLVEVSGLPDSTCSARVRLPTETTVPAMNEWGMIIAVLGVFLAGIYLYRRRTIHA